MPRCQHLHRSSSSRWRARAKRWQTDHDRSQAGLSLDSARGSRTDATPTLPEHFVCAVSHIKDVTQNRNFANSRHAEIGLTTQQWSRDSGDLLSWNAAARSATLAPRKGC
jgi:hypothetical protein